MTHQIYTDKRSHYGRKSKPVDYPVEAPRDVAGFARSHWESMSEKTSPALLFQVATHFRSEASAYRTALTRILKWAREHTYNNWSEAGDAEAYANGPAEELIDALADAGFEIDHDGVMVVHGERVRE